MKETPTAQQPIQTLHRPIYPMSQPPQRPHGSRKRLWFIIGIVAAVMVIAIVGASIRASQSPKTSTLPATQATEQVTPYPTEPPVTQPIQEVTPEPTFIPTTIPTTAPTPTPQPTPTTEQQLLSIAQKSGALGKNMTVKYSASSNTAKITETIGVAWSKASAKRDIQFDCFDIQKAVWTSQMHVSGIEVDILGPLVDKYGNESTGLIGTCTLLDTTAQKVNWSNLSPRIAWQNQIYDDQWLLPDLNT